MRPIWHIGREHTASPGWPLSGLDGQWLLLAGLRLPAPGSVRGRCESTVAVSTRPIAATRPLLRHREVYHRPRTLCPSSELPEHRRSHDAGRNRWQWLLQHEHDSGRRRKRQPGASIALHRQRCEQGHQHRTRHRRDELPDPVSYGHEGHDEDPAPAGGQGHHGHDSHDQQWAPAQGFNANGFAPSRPFPADHRPARPPPPRGYSLVDTGGPRVMRRPPDPR